jgi:hypothetical protein
MPSPMATDKKTSMKRLRKRVTKKARKLTKRARKVAMRAAAEAQRTVSRKRKSGKNETARHTAAAK